MLELWHQLSWEVRVPIIIAVTTGCGVIVRFLYTRWEARRARPVLSYSLATRPLKASPHLWQVTRELLLAQKHDPSTFDDWLDAHCALTFTLRNSGHTSLYSLDPVLRITHGSLAGPVVFVGPDDTLERGSTANFSSDAIRFHFDIIAPGDVYVLKIAAIGPIQGRLQLPVPGLILEEEQSPEKLSRFSRWVGCLLHRKRYRILVESDSI
jgi:hypothetical protein